MSVERKSLVQSLGRKSVEPITDLDALADRYAARAEEQDLRARRFDYFYIETADEVEARAVRFATIKENLSQLRSNIADHTHGYFLGYQEVADDVLAIKNKGVVPKVSRVFQPKDYIYKVNFVLGQGEDTRNANLSYVRDGLTNRGVSITEYAPSGKITSAFNKTGLRCLEFETHDKSEKVEANLEYLSLTYRRPSEDKERYFDYTDYKFQGVENSFVARNPHGIAPLGIDHYIDVVTTILDQSLIKPKSLY